LVIGLLALDSTHGSVRLIAVNVSKVIGAFKATAFLAEMPEKSMGHSV